MNLSERYRPTTLSDFIGQAKAVKVVKRIADRGLGGRAFWISGATGIGKTTLARIIAGMIADDFYVAEYDSADDFKGADVDRMRETMCLYSLGKGGRAWIINEAHGLRRAVVRQLLGILERLPEHCVVIFTTTKLGEKALFEDQIDAHPLLSRCVQVALTNQGVVPLFAKRLKQGAEAEGLDGKPLSAYVRVLNDCHSNLREAWQVVENGDMLT